MRKLTAIEGLDPALAERLEANGIWSVEALLRVGATVTGRRVLAARTGIDPIRVLQLVIQADLMRVEGIEFEHAALLEAAGVDGVPNLATRTADILAAKLAEVNRTAELVRAVPSASVVAAWVSRAEGLGRVLVHTESARPRAAEIGAARSPSFGGRGEVSTPDAWPRRSGPILVALTFATVIASPVAAQEPITWEGATELSFVSTGGNASSSTLGLKAALTGKKNANVFRLEMGGVRSETGTTTRTATGTIASHTINETTVSLVTAASYFAKGRYDREFGQMFAFTGAGWDRNTFSGIQNRYALVAGVGRTFVDGDNGHLKADVGATYTIQKDVDPAPGADEGFGGLRFGLDAKRKLSETAEYLSALTVDENVEDTKDLRADWTHSIAVALSERLALKTSVQLLYDNQPSLLGVPLVDAGGLPTGSMVSTPGDKVDRILTLTLVIKL